MSFLRRFKKRPSPTASNHPPSQKLKVEPHTQTGGSSASAIDLTTSDEDAGADENMVGVDDWDSDIQYLNTPTSGQPDTAHGVDDGDDDDDEFDFGAEDDYGDAFGDEETTHLETSVAIVGQGGLDDDIHSAQVMLEDTGVEIHQADSNVVITLSIVELPPLARAACGLTRPAPTITVTLEVDRGYRRTCPIPVINVRHGEVDVDGISTSTLRATPGFPVGLQLCQAALQFFEHRWQNRGENFLSDLSLRLKDRLFNAGNYCMMCDDEFTHPGVKPTVCNKQLCAYQLETLGLGADLSLFESDPAVADLLITFATAAMTDVTRMQVSPVAMPVDHDDTPFTPANMVTVLNSIPDAVLVGEVAGDRKALLDVGHASAARVAAWLFASNRAHIVSVAPEKRIQAMLTDYQFHIHTSTRQHAEKFAKLRAEHGSFYAFHGSGLQNWHNILRQNLKVASKTPLMSVGAAYGEGIYMGANSVTSASYVRPGRGWDHSEFGTAPVCLALVEVANSSRVHWHAQNQIVVANDESCVMLHHLFIYKNSGAIPNVAAKSIVQFKYKNQTTIAYGSSYDEVERSGKLLVTSDEYFWDMDEVVGMVQARHGLFINGYNQLPFAPADVKAILEHPSGAGKVLKELEKKNVVLRKQIPREVYNRLRLVGEICVRDTTLDFTSAHKAIAELHSWLQGLEPKVKDALARAPFEAVDTHTRQPFRDTVAHAVELVVSGGECVHRFGDFLKQVSGRA
ncbi:hypothetical protein Q8F55_000077 [Vanrija albida]|uniref:PARP catalytic domain-containing protein n=1 Tax=Vanrija albida TaxID=181172 RepID=A0ABR3QCB0_9TREE